MKTLLILRHAKSSWSQPGARDYDRPLNQRGKRDAPRMGALILERGLIPQLILSSSAKRARKTAAKFAKACEYDGEVRHIDDFYLAPPEAYINALRQLDDQVACAMVVGHNPGVEDLLKELTGNDEVMPTAALGHIQIDIDRWSEIAVNGSAKLVELWRPSELT